jgi:hypothetical protein
MANRICYTRDGDAEVRPAALEQRDQRRGGGDRRQLLAAGPARCHVRQHFLNLQERSEEGSPRTSSPTASGGWSPAVSSPGARHPWSPRRIPPYRGRNPARHGHGRWPARDVFGACWRLLRAEPVASVSRSVRGRCQSAGRDFPTSSSNLSAPGKTSLFPAGRADLGDGGGCDA